ncbi:TetR/AcrR family transcriptional regulator [Phytoactinopolyspora mesophila]|uniref:TetR/AcrR family transcriptional regulator n=1 Tax=Phytoactinopolyspora mesophila TaxID=2650750 RepID=UPI001C9E49AF
MRSKHQGQGASGARLTASDWAQAALTAIGEGGLAAVAVEPLATRLGATKGSFYWHFQNRKALIEAALRLWEREHTEMIISAMEADPDPAARLRRLFTLVVGYSRHDRIEIALMATADDPMVAPVVQGVTERRVAYVAAQFEQLGLPVGEARGRALLAVSVYLGHIQLAHAAPETLPRDSGEWERHLSGMVDTFLP